MHISEKLSELERTVIAAKKRSYKMLTRVEIGRRKELSFGCLRAHSSLYCMYVHFILRQFHSSTPSEAVATVPRRSLRGRGTGRPWQLSLPPRWSAAPARRVCSKRSLLALAPLPAGRGGTVCPAPSWLAAGGVPPRDLPTPRECLWAGPVVSARLSMAWKREGEARTTRRSPRRLPSPYTRRNQSPPPQRGRQPPPFPGPRTLPPPPPNSPFRARLSSSHPPPLPTIFQLLPPRLAPPTATRCSKPDEPVRPRRQHHHLLPSVACHGVGRGGRGAQRGDAWAPPPAARAGTQPAGARPRAAPTHPSKGRNVVGWRAAKGAALKAPPLSVTVLLPWERL